MSRNAEAAAALEELADFLEARDVAFGLLTDGVHTARRGWATAGDPLNCRDAGGVRAFVG